MKSTAFAAVALIFAALALGLAIMDVGPSSRPLASDSLSTLSTGETPADLDRRLAALEERIEQMQGAVDALKMRPAPAPFQAEARQPVEETEEARSDVEARLKQMEEWVAAREERRVGMRDLLAFQGRRDEEEERRSLEDWTHQALDPSSTPEQMLDALRSLRGETLADGTDARLPVLPEMIDLALNSTDGSVRANVWRQLDEVTDPRLLGPLMDALSRDADPSAREEAAETLAPFLPDPSVEAALRFALENDVDPNVREQAAESLDDRR